MFKIYIFFFKLDIKGVSWGNRVCFYNKKERGFGDIRVHTGDDNLGFVLNYKFGHTLSIYDGLCLEFGIG